ncbi:unnamed protein product [Rotaria sordida]|uniref:Uncharacterized protein n=1 Tax=Rotaria sordida TaxID=392033 RepID=A0A815GYT5_9BILA|nr:unnamed protein product [Rotaria sordida]CAF1598698.1 unnamed protein product [Rotaria sordida]
MQKLINYVRNCNEFTFDTEGEKSTKQLALIQIQAIPQQLPFFVILVELAHLPPIHSLIHLQIKQLFELIFTFRNDILLGTITLSNGRNIIINDINSEGQMNLLSKCTCHKSSPYRPNEPWALQQALIYTYGMFIDKSITVNEWTMELDPMYSTLSTSKRNKMIHYAIYDCFTATCLLRPVTLYWTFQQVTKINILDSFQALLSSTQANNNPTNTNIKQQIIKNINDDIELIPDDDDEITVNQSISDDDNEPNSALPPNDNDLRVNNHDMVDHLSDYEQQQQSLTKKRQLNSRTRSAEARKRRNRKRNVYFRMQRYRYFIIRPFYCRFTMKLVRHILAEYSIYYTHVKPVDDLLLIGVKDKIIEPRNDRRLPGDIFDRRYYYLFRRRAQYLSRRSNDIQE